MASVIGSGRYLVTLSPPYLASRQKYPRGAQSGTNQGISILDLHCTVVLEVVFTTKPYLSRSKGIIDFDGFTGLMLGRWAVSKVK
jgi:hypothetical protein